MKSYKTGTGVRSVPKKHNQVFPSVALVFLSFLTISLVFARWECSISRTNAYAEETVTQTELEKPETDWLSCYADAIDFVREYQRDVKYNPAHTDFSESAYRLDREICGSGLGGYPLGYRLQDLNSDGVPELLIGVIQSDEFENMGSSKDVIAALFTLNEGKPLELLASRTRIRAYLSSLGEICLFGTGGAVDHIADLYRLENNQLIIIETIGSTMDMASQDGIRYYHDKGDCLAIHYDSFLSSAYSYIESGESEMRKNAPDITEEEHMILGQMFSDSVLPLGDLIPIEF